MWKLFGQGKSSPKLLAESKVQIKPIQFLIDAKEERLNLERLRDQEITQLVAKWDAKVALVVTESVKAIKAACTHKVNYRIVETEHWPYGSGKRTILEGYYCPDCGNFFFEPVASAENIHVVTPSDICTMYGYK